MKRCMVLGLSALLFSLTAVTPAGAAAGTTICRMDYTLKGWSAFYKRSLGSGTITCDNGQTAKAKLSVTGGGLTAGKSEIRDGNGQFTEVADIRELFGTYAAATAAAGAVKSSEAQALTKGEVSLALAGTGTGMELGVSFSRFTIIKR
ncbi:MAG TPA: hypothetical protein VMW27_09490 [Thermoanaerobaculia bacterium]|nr:hypothetical protein [Thermoanaerobaculia bacterium]